MKHFENEIPADEVKRVLGALLESLSPEQLWQELNKGDRAALHAISDCNLVPDAADFELPAKLSSFKGQFLLSGEKMQVSPHETRAAAVELPLAA